MQIKVHKPKLNQQKQWSDQQQKPIRMTLKEYLESTNLKRRINSRSKSKSKKQSVGQLQDERYLEPPNYNQTVEYFKLSQQWKAKKIFHSWIDNLKQLTRQFIKADSEYVQVIRVIQKIVEFVKNQIQTIKKDNLLLQSYLVTEASYWPAQGSTYNQQVNNDKLSNYIKKVLGKNDYCESPSKSQQIIQTSSPQLPQSLSLLNNKAYKTSTQPKLISKDIEFTTKHHSKNHNTNSSSTGVKLSHDQDFSISQTLHKKFEPNLQKEQYIYSFKDRSLDSRPNTSQEGKLYRQNVHVNPFSHSQNAYRIDEENQSLQNSKYPDTALLKIHSKNQDEVPRLSLMSRYDQNKNPSYSIQDEDNISKTKINDTQPQRVNHFSQVSTKSQISHAHQTKLAENKIPLRERKQKVQKLTSQCTDEFQMIVLDPRINLNKQECYQQTNLNHQGNRNTHKSDINNGRTQEKDHMQKGRQIHGHKQFNYQTSPLAVRNNPHIFSLQTPSTLRRRHPTSAQITQTKKYDEIRVNVTNPLYPSNQLNNRSARSNSAVYKSSIISYQSSSLKESQQNIMKRYENYAN